MGAEIGKAALTATFSDETMMQPGNIAYDTDGNKYIKCKAGVGSGAGAYIEIDTAVANATKERGYIVPSIISIVADETQRAIARNVTGGTVPIGNYFWALALSTAGPIIENHTKDGSAFTRGDHFYLDGVNVTSTAGVGNTQAAGFVLQTAAGGATTVHVILCPHDV